MDGENVLDYTAKLQQIFPSDIKIAFLHGKMHSREKNKIMESFAAGEIQILVSTTVIEVGVNVPNATVMMVENAERLAGTASSASGPCGKRRTSVLLYFYAGK